MACISSEFVYGVAKRAYFTVFSTLHEYWVDDESLYIAAIAIDPKCTWCSCLVLLWTAEDAAAYEYCDDFEEDTPEEVKIHHILSFVIISISMV